MRTGWLAFAPLALVTLVGSSQVRAQTPAPAAGGPLTGALQRQYNGVKRNVVEAAEKMPEADYGFRPVDTVRTYGQFIGHVADSLNFFCSSAKGEKMPVEGSAEKLATKTELVAALNKAFGYCDEVYNGMTDTKAMTLQKMGQNEVPVAAPLFNNISHTNEHYGNLVTYLRIKGLVPPSTERAQRR
jgi:uncharacterized damage-inducible protein DinB